MWFERLFGFIELANVPYRQGHKYRGVATNPELNKKIQSCFDITQDEHGYQTIVSKSNGRVFPVGKFSTPTLSELRQNGRNKLLNSTRNEVSIEHIVVDDLIELHATSNGDIFQAASQFNCLEFASQYAVPEMGIEIYESDRTQGPAVALACAAGTLIRNYFVPIPTAVGGGDAGIEECNGQSIDNQLNNLDQFELLVDNKTNNYFEITNGYSFSSEGKLHQLSEYIKSLSVIELDELRDSIKVGVHENVGVTFSSRRGLKDDAYITHSDVRVTQVYCSALSCNYSGVERKHWEVFATLVQEAIYESMLWAAVLNAPPFGSQIRNVYLTFVGGGVFGNEMDWILAAIARAVVSLEQANAALNIKICHFRALKPTVISRFNEFYADHKRTVMMNELCKEEDECVPYQWIEGDSLAPPCQSDRQVVQGLIDFCHFIKPSDIVYDLGCGDGRIPIAVSNYYSCKSYGVEIEEQLIERFHHNLLRMSNLDTRLSALVTPIHADLRTVDLSHATVLIIYLLPEAIESIKDLLIALLNNNCVIICNTWGIKGLVPMETKSCGLYLPLLFHEGRNTVTSCQHANQRQQVEVLYRTLGARLMGSTY